MVSRMKFVLITLAVAACGGSTQTAQAPTPAPAPAPAAAAPAAARPAAVTTAPTTNPGADPRVGLKAGMWDAAEATSNLKVSGKAQPPEGFRGITNSDITFVGKYAVQGNYNGFIIWDVSTPTSPTLVTAYTCPASQNDVSVYKQQLLFMSAEALNGRVDCSSRPFTAADSVSKERIRGVRIFDITDIAHPKYVTSVQTCRGSHTHTVVEDPKDPNNIYLYVSGSSGVRSPTELPGCIVPRPGQYPSGTSLFNIEVIKVPLANPASAAIINRAKIFENLAAITSHGEAPDDRATRIAAVNRAKAAGAFTVVPANGLETVFNANQANVLLDSIAKARGAAPTPAPATPAPAGFGAPPHANYVQNAADTAALRTYLPKMIAAQIAVQAALPQRGPNQCHDITVYPALGLAGGACGGYGLLLDISDPTNPVRIDQVADSNFAYWHSATFNNDGTKLLFSDEWGGGGAPKCRASDPKEWGADAIFSVTNRKLKFESYYKLTAPQTALENCVAHNGSLIPIPDRDIMVQSWYQGGVSVFDWTDAAKPKEIAFFDRGPSDSTRQGPGGTWSVYWYNGYMFSSEIARGLDVMDLTPSEHISANEILAAKTVQFPFLNVQGQPKLVWPPSFALACSYLDQLERDKGLDGSQIASARAALSRAEGQSAADRRTTLVKLASDLTTQSSAAKNPAKVRKLAYAVNDLSSAQNAAPCARQVS